MELLDKLKTEHQAVRRLESVLWNGKPVCGHCGGDDKSSRTKSKRNHYWRGHCRKRFTVRTNTVLGASNLPVRKWLYAMRLLQTARKGISSLQLSKELGITQKSAWFLLQRIGEAHKPGGFQLPVSVEVDETYLGGHEANKHGNKKLRPGRGAVGKQAVLGTRERTGRVQAMPIQQTDKGTIQGEIGRSAAPGSTIYADEHRAYLGLGEDYDHKSVNHSAKEFMNAMAHANGIESVWAVLKRGFNGAYHKWSVKHCKRCVDEFAFRLNEGNCQVDAIDRIKSLCRGVIGKRITYRGLISRMVERERQRGAGPEHCRLREALSVSVAGSQSMAVETGE